LTRFIEAMLIGALLALAACSPEIDRVYEVDSVRVLGVQKTVDRGGLEPEGAAYARPGETVNFHMLWDRGSRNTDTDTLVERMWIKGCVNPDGDSYIGCAGLFAEAAANPEEFLAQNVIRSEPLEAARPSLGDTLRVEMPGTDMLRPREEGQGPPYALYMLFFAVCAGDLGISADNVSVEDGRLPVTCTRDGEPLGADDFVVGYTSVYIYENQPNSNPRVKSMYFDQFFYPLSVELTGSRVSGTLCAGVGCLAAPDPTEDDKLSLCAAGLCVAACPGDGDMETCPPHWIRPDLDRDALPNREPDTVSMRPGVVEQLTVHYHADRGSMRSDVRVLRDGTGQWNENFVGQYYAPKEPGWARIWAIVRDNRGGSDWVSTPIWVEQSAQ
jgi:hypothetical protein